MMNYPTLCPPHRYVWDFWYWYEAATQQFHVFYLNAPPEEVTTGQHHQLATVGYGRTQDFTQMQWGPYDVLTASPQGWDNTAIWTGDVLAVQSGFVMFYTSRDRNRDDGYTQAIGMATAPQIDARHWQRIGWPLEATPDYELRSIKGDLSVHAWRDPFLFRHGGDSYMLLSAKVPGQVGRNGAVAWLRASGHQLSRWQPLPPLAAPGEFSEMEVPQLYRRPDGQLELLFSSTAALDFSPQTPQQGGVYALTGQTFADLARQSPRNRLAAASGLYACRAIPEMGGELVGFDWRSGGIRRSGIKTELCSLDRDFSTCML